MTKRTMAIGFALLLWVVLINSRPVYAQSSQRNCVGDYARVVEAAWQNFSRADAEISAQGYWQRTFNPLNVINRAGNSFEYWARSQSAYYQMYACSAFPR